MIYTVVTTKWHAMSKVSLRRLKCSFKIAQFLISCRFGLVVLFDKNF